MFRNNRTASLKARLENILKKSSILDDSFLVAITDNPDGGTDVYFFELISGSSDSVSVDLVEVATKPKGSGYIPTSESIGRPFSAKMTPKGALIQNKVLSNGYPITAIAKSWDGNPIIEEHLF